MKPNIIFISIDSLRSDKLFGSSYTPNINKLISNGVNFSNTISTSDSTGLSLGSIFTGAYPFKTNISLTSFNHDFPTYFDLLKNNGYFLTSTCPDLSFFKKLTINFDLNNLYIYDKRNEWIQLHGGIGNEIITTLKLLKSKSPWFYFIHLMDLHQPFYLPDEFNQNKFGLTRYDKMISYIDEWIGKFIKNIDFKNTLLVFTSDHGDYIPLTDDENFSYTPNKFFKKMNKIVPKKLSTKILSTLQEKKKIDFANSVKNNQKLSRSILDRGTDFLYDESLKIPLFFYGNNLKFHHSIPNLVRHVDIFSTILDIIGIKYFSDIVDGRSLLPLFKSRSQDFISSPESLICLPFSRFLGKTTPLSHSVVSSTGTIHSQPSGILAPVIILIALPLVKTSSELSPAKIVLLTFTHSPASSTLTA